MASARLSLLLFLVVLAGGMSLYLSGPPRQLASPAAGDWRRHPALAEPDGMSHRGDPLVAASIDDPRILAELSRRFRRTKPLGFVRRGDETEITGAEDFERRQEYFLRLLDHYYFEKLRLLGMTRKEVEAIFGPLGPDPRQGRVSGGRDFLQVWFKEGRVSDAFYVMGY